MPSDGIYMAEGLMEERPLSLNSLSFLAVISIMLREREDGDTPMAWAASMTVSWYFCNEMPLNAFSKSSLENVLGFLSIV